MILWNDQFLDREEVRIDLEDRGYQFGDGIYEVIRVYKGHLFEMEAHLKRLERSLKSVRIPFSLTFDQLKTNLVELVSLNHLEDGIIYLQITRGASPRNHAFPYESKSVLTAYTKPLDRPLNDLKSGIKVLFTEDIRWLRCDIKSLNLLGNVMAKQEAQENGYQEAIFHRQETVTEGSSSNVFIIKGQALLTHPANHLILNGITRLWVLDRAAQLGLEMEEKPFTKDQLLSADEVFITSTTQEVMPVYQIGASLVGNGKPGPYTCQFQDLFNKDIL